MALSRDGKVLATSAYRKGIVLWDVAQGKSVKSLECKGNESLALAFSPDGVNLALTTRDGAMVIKVATGKVVWRCKSKSDAEDDWIWFLDFSPDGKMLVAADYSCISLLDAATGKQITKWCAPGWGSTSVAIS